MILRVFGLSGVVTVAALVAAFLYGGWEGAVVCLILGILEISLSFDNAVINATVLERMSVFWQRMFLTVGVLIAVFGMRVLFPLVIVWATAGLNPKEALDLALNPPPDGAETFADGSPSYETLLTDAHPQIAALGGMFLLMLFLNFVFSQDRLHWMRHVERPLARMGLLPNISVMVALAALLTTASLMPSDQRATVLIAGIVGLLLYLVINGLTSLFESGDALDDADDENPADPTAAGRRPKPVQVAGKAAFFLFLYLEMLDASFSFDGVIGAFAITSDPILIALGLGFIGAMFVRSITIYLVRAGTLSEYRYLENGAHWAIGALATILLVSLHVEVSELVTGLVGVCFIGAAVISSIRANRTEARSAAPATPAGRA
ncbi:DUF475 domain-containing protein [Gordonia sp. VNK21]|uniref:DUF475 domain-containing protein n=1 Tax=Gordonia sp. VNK21 TaxID=3382483 RepID=UPI0038D41B48